MDIKGMSFYVNPNNRTLTTDIKNTVVSDKSMYATLSNKLRPVDDLQVVLTTPIKLAGKTSIDTRRNSINLAEGARVTVSDGFVLTVKKEGVEVSGGNIDNDKARQEAMEMGGALSTLLRNACGIMKNTAYSPEAYDKWTKNVSKVLGYFGIDTSKDFSVNGMNYSKDENGHFVSQAKIEAVEEYERLKSANRYYESADERTRRITSHMTNYYLKNVPEDVTSAWWETIEETGINPFPEGYTGALQQLSMEQDFLSSGNDDIFGNTKESSIIAIERIIERIDNPIGKATNDDLDYRGLEREFYSTLLGKIREDAESVITDTTVSRHTEYTDPETEEIVPVDIKYITLYSDEGVSCKEIISDGDKDSERELWSIQYDSPDSYEKIQGFLRSFSDDQKLTFATQESFWKDFMKDDFDTDSFRAYYDSTDNGIIDFDEAKADGKSLREALTEPYAEYINNNHFAGHVYSEDDLQPSWYKNGQIRFDVVYDPSVPTEISSTSSFVSRVFTEEELFQYVDDRVKSNQGKKKSLFDMLKDSSPEGTSAMFQFAGESKTYDFFDFIDEFERRSKKERA